jgi:hypothetical protein
MNEYNFSKAMQSLKDRRSLTKNPSSTFSSLGFSKRLGGTSFFYYHSSSITTAARVTLKLRFQQARPAAGNPRRQRPSLGCPTDGLATY